MVGCICSHYSKYGSEQANGHKKQDLPWPMNQTDTILMEYEIDAPSL